MESEQTPIIKRTERSTTWNINPDDVYAFAKSFSKGFTLGFCEAVGLVGAMLFVVYHILKFFNDL